MRTLLLIALGTASMGFAQGEDEKKEIVRQLELKDAKIDPRKDGGVVRPMKITSKEELVSTVKDTDTQDAIAKVVDFDKEYVLIFTWGGSGADKLTAASEKDVVTFTLKRGLTKDLRQHAPVFALAKEATWVVAK